MARSNAAEVIGADGYAVRGPVSAAAASGCALIETGDNQLGWSAAAVSQVGHTHDDRYYTEAEVTALLAGKVGTTGNWVMAGQLTANGLVLAPGNALLSSPSSDAINFPNGIALNINSGLPRFFAMNTLTFQTNSSSVQHKFGNEIGPTLTGTVVEISGGVAGAGTGAKLLDLTNTGASVASIDRLGNILGWTLTLGGALTAGGVTTSGTVSAGMQQLLPMTFAAVTSLSASAYERYFVSVSDRGDRLAYSDGTNWRWVGTDARLAEEQEHYLVFHIPAGTTGLVNAPIEIPWAFTITEWQIVSASGGAISGVLDVWVDTYANFPPTIADTIVAAAKPTITSAVKANSTTLTAWTVNLAKGSLMMVNVESLTGAAVLRIKGVKQ